MAANFSCVRWLLLLLLLCVPALAQSEAVPPGVAAAYQNLSESWRRLDAVAVMRFFTPDVHMIDGRGQSLDYAGVTRIVTEAMADAKSCEIEYAVKSWKQVDDTIEVLVHQTRKITYSDKEVVRVAEREEHWCKTEAGWQFYDVHFLHQEVTINSTAHSRRHKTQ